MTNPKEMNMSKPLAIITGASSGIGEATAKTLSAQGHPLLLIARRVKKLEALNLPNTLCCKVDVTDLKQFQNAVDKAEKLYGPADLLLNNAGVMLLSLIEDQDPNEWKTMFDVNVMGVLNGIKTVVQSMIDRRTGTIVNISSIAGRKTFPNHAVYCGTKFAVHAMTENIREETAAHNVRLITVAPGPVETELLSHTTSSEIKEGYQAWKEDIGGALATDDIVRSIMFVYQQPQNVCIRELVIAPTAQQP